MIKKLLAFIFLFFIVNTYTVLDNLSDALNNFTKELEQMRVWYVKEVRPDVILTNSFPWTYENIPNLSYITLIEFFINDLTTRLLSVDAIEMYKNIFVSPDMRYTIQDCRNFLEIPLFKNIKL